LQLMVSQTLIVIHNTDGHELYTHYNKLSLIFTVGVVTLQGRFNLQNATNAMEILVVIMDHAQTDMMILTHVLVTTDMRHLVEHARTLMNVRPERITVIPMPAALIQLEVSAALVIQAIMETERTVQILMNVQQHHVTEMQTVLIILELTLAHVAQDTLEMEHLAQTSMNVHRALLIVMRMQAVRIRLEVLHVRAIPVIMEMDKHAPTSMNVHLVFIIVIPMQVVRIR